MQAFILVILTTSIRNSVGNVVSIAQGKIRGIANDGYVSYIGIPYGSADKTGGRFKVRLHSIPSTDIVSFQQPGLAPTWADIRESRDPNCSSRSEVENCLQLDINVPNVGSSFPVLVWTKGSSGDYHPGKLIQRGIIIVIVRHRLGPLGFLCANKHKVAGNAALKDVLQALRWVRDNIVAFNGNPNKVIIAGQSFGAAMVEALTLSSAARGLFHGVILQSGTVLAPWAFNFDAENRAAFLNIQFNGTADIFKLSQVRITDLVNKAEEVGMPYLPFGICDEGSHKHEEKIITDSPFDLLSRREMNAVPLIMGYNSNEAYIFANTLKAAKVKHEIGNNMAFILPVELQMHKRDMPSIMKTIKDMYFKENVTVKNLMTYHRDGYFLAHIHRSVRFHASVNPVYYYQFSYNGNVGVDEESQFPKTGAAHSDELAYLFPEKGRDLNGDDGLVQDHMLKLWSNFVKHLSPTPDGGDDVFWDPVNLSSTRILDISTVMEMVEFPYTREMQLWDDIYEKYFFRKRSQIV